jgi:DNA primase
VLDWVMKTQGVSLPHAVQLLRHDAPLEGAEKVGVNRSQARHLPSLAAGSDEAVLLREVADTYHATLKQSPEAQGYLVQRGLVHGELMDTFRLGYANKSLTYRLPPGYSKEGRDVRAKLQRVGVYRESGHEHLNGCLVVPVFDLESGTGWSTSDRCTGDGLRRVTRFRRVSRSTCICRCRLPVCGTKWRWLPAVK